MHIEKAKSSQVIGYILHDTRACENHTNEKIDPAKAELNYNLVEGSPLENFNRRMEQVFMRKNKNANALAMFTTTLPKDFPSERSEEFFRACHRFYCDKFGEENIISDMVHRDETTEHMHTKLIPVYFNEKKQRDTVSFDKVINRNVYRSIHKDLQRHLEREFGFEVHILNGATAGGNKTIQELKAEEIKKKNNLLQAENDALQEKTNLLEDEIFDLKQEIDNLRTTQHVYQQRNDELADEIEQKKEDLQLLKCEDEYLQEYNYARTLLERIRDAFDSFYSKVTYLNFNKQKEAFFDALEQSLDKFMSSIKKLIVYEDYHSIPAEEQLSRKLDIDSQIKSSDDIRSTRNSSKTNKKIKEKER